MTDELHPYDVIERVVLSGIDTTQGMKRLIEYCEIECPSKAWDILRGLDFNDDVASLKYWLEQLLTTSPPRKGFQAFWFGLFNPIVEDEASCDIYISGSTHFDPDDPDWQCWRSDSYLPEGKYAGSKVLHEVYQIIQLADIETFPRPCKRKGLCGGGTRCWLGEYVLCLRYGCLAINEVLNSNDLSLILYEDQKRVIAVGYDSGNSIILGTVNRNGWILGKA